MPNKTEAHANTNIRLAPYSRPCVFTCTLTMVRTMERLSSANWLILWRFWLMLHWTPNQQWRVDSIHGPVGTWSTRASYPLLGVRSLVDQIAVISNTEPRHCEYRRNYAVVYSYWQLCVRTWFWVVENLTADVLLRTSLVDQCICRMVSTVLKIFPCHLKPVPLFSAKMAINSMNANDVVLKGNTNLQDDASSDEFSVLSHWTSVNNPAYTQVAVRVSFWGAGIMEMEIHYHVVKRRCSITVQSLMDFVPGKQFHIFNAN